MAGERQSSASRPDGTNMKLLSFTDAPQHSNIAATWSVAGADGWPADEGRERDVEARRSLQLQLNFSNARGNVQLSVVNGAAGGKQRR